MAIPQMVLIAEDLFGPKPTPAPAADMGRFQIHKVSVDVYAGRHGQREIHLAMAVNDVLNPSKVIHVQSHTSCQEEVPLKYVVREAVIRLVTHEVDEWLRINGEMVTNAHAND